MANFPTLRDALDERKVDIVMENGVLQYNPADGLDVRDLMPGSSSISEALLAIAKWCELSSVAQVDLVDHVDEINAATYDPVTVHLA